MISSRDLVKGVLILLVIVDHNEYLRNLGSGFFNPLFVHVAGFFILSFIATSQNNLSLLVFAKERLVRYGVPFLSFYVFYSLIFIVVSGGRSSYFDYFLNDWVPGLLIGSFDAVKRGCGGAFMWFLPSLLGFSLLSKITFLGRTIKYVVIGSSLALYFIPEYIMRSSGAHLPIGIGLSLYLLPVFFIGKWIAEYLSNIDRKHDAKLFVLSASVLIGSHWILNSTRGVLELGSLDVPSMRTPIEFIVLLFGLISSYLTIDRFTRRGKVAGRGWNWLAMIGNNSLVIYLVHQLALHLVYKLFKPEFMLNYGVLINIALGFISVMAAIVFSYLFGCFLKSHIPSARFILPG